MRHSVLTALSAVMSRPTILHGSGSDPWGDGVARISKSLWLLRHPRTSLVLARLFASSNLRPLLRIEPRLMFKFLGDYLAADLSRSERAAMLIHHYAVLKARADREFFSRIAEQRLELWQLEVEEHIHRIWLSFPRTPHGEGDLTLIFEADGVDIYTLSFTIGPGSIAGLASPDAMFIARVQGMGNGIDRIREATKSCGDVSPAALLIAAVEGIAQTLDIDNMIGIGADVHVVLKKTGRLENLVKAYDEFWTTLGGSRLARNMYHLTVPGSAKSILEVKRDHRSRTQRKRRFKKSVRNRVSETFRERALAAR
jgi:uncharacterized protein VirK/YbjX